MNAVPNNAMPSTNLAFEPAGPMELKRILGAYFTAARYEFVQTLRAPAFALPFLVMPVALYFLFGVMMASGSEDMAANPQTGISARVQLT